MSASPFQRFIPFLAVLGSVTALGVGTSWAKQALFPVVGAQGTTAVRVGLSALLMLMLWRPWRWRLSRADAQAVVLYGAALGAMNLMFYLSLQTLPFGLAVAIEFAGPLAVAIWSSRRAVDFVWVALAIVGLALLLPLGHDVSAVDPVGVGYALAAAARLQLDPADATAADLLEESLKLLPRNPPAALRLAGVCRARGQAEKANALEESARGMWEPAVPARIDFRNGVSLRGLSLDRNDARPGESDQRIGFGDHDIPHKCKRGRDTSHRGIGQHGNERQTMTRQLGDGGRGFGHLH